MPSYAVRVRLDFILSNKICNSSCQFFIHGWSNRYKESFSELSLHTSRKLQINYRARYLMSPS